MNLLNSKARQFIIESLRVGATYLHFHSSTRKTHQAVNPIAKQGKSNEFISGNPDPLVADGIFALLILERPFYIFPNPRSGDLMNCFAAFLEPLEPACTLVFVSSMTWRKSLVHGFLVGMLRFLIPRLLFIGKNLLALVSLLVFLPPLLVGFFVVKFEAFFRHKRLENCWA